MNANVMAWNADERRNGSMIVLGVAVVLALGALAMWWFVAATPAWLYWALVGALALVLVATVVMVFVQPKAQAAVAEAAPEAAPAPDAEAAPMQVPAAFEPRVLTLRCGDCGTIFDVTDTGERPLYHTCPGCGAEGALRDPPAAVEASPEASAAPATEAYAPPAAEPEPAYAAPAAASAPAPTVKKLKLRCGGCKEVFSIEDSGERPLRRACPHCGRMGQIN